MTGDDARRSPARWWTILGVCLVAACSSTKVPEKPGDAAVARGTFKVGKPYEVRGVWYYPKVDWEYAESGVASWYGPGFHGERTANGEIYDMNALTAAHTTLPLPSIVRVTNLENGRSVKLRVNDRGPFVDGRIIDTSRRAAQLLGFHGQGTARVRVEIVADESRVLASMLSEQNGDVARSTIQETDYNLLAAVEPPPMPAPAVEVASFDGPTTASPLAGGDAWDRPEEAAPPAETGVGRTFIQAGAFADPGNAWKARHRLARLGAVQVSSLTAGGRELFRVRLGPFSSDEEAQAALSATIREGFGGSVLVLE
jgi:rare lipoprotein A